MSDNKSKKIAGKNTEIIFVSHMSAQVTVTVVLLLILAGLVLQIYVKNQYFNLSAQEYQINGRIHD